MMPLQDLAGMDPGPPPGPDQSLLARLMALGSVDQRHKLLQTKYDAAGQLSGGVPVDYAHGKGTPLLLSGLANLLSAGVGGYQQGKAQGGLSSLIDEQTAGRTAGANAMLNAPMPNLSSLLTASDSEMPGRASAAQDAISGQRKTGLMALLSGDPTMAGAGKSMYGDADKAQETMLGMPQARQQLASGGVDLASKLRAAAMANSPVVGGAGAALLKRLGIKVPDGASPSEIQAILPLAEKEAAAEKFQPLSPGSSLYNAHNGKVIQPGGASGANASMLDPAALDQAAELFHATGQLPSVGMGNAGALARRQIINRAAELHPEGGIAGNKAGYKADTGSLTSLQKQADAMESFESTALKNLDQFTGVARSVVDTGSPLFNAPARVFMQQVAGDPKMAQFATARNVAVQEISKVLGGSLGGTAVSDSARHEASGLIGPDMSLAQIEAVANILKQDMANRKASVNAQIGTIKGRMSGKPAQAETPAAPPFDAAALRKKYGISDAK